MKVAIEGCCHGELDNIYAAIEHAEKVEGIKVDLLICCGDFQAVRNREDLETMACPPKYRDMRTFYKYYSGEKVAYVPTIFIGGNHEAASHLWELPFGGWVAPNIFYLGFAGVVNFGGIRIGGLSGIYNQRHYRLGHFEHPPFDNESMRTFYHIREFEVYQLSQIKQPIDIFLSHDWPANIAHHGNLEQLLRWKQHLRSEILDGSLGSPPGEHLLHTLKPDYWFSAHLHVKYPALVKHNDEHATKFLALDKCLPHREFLQLVDFPDTDAPKNIMFDEEWLTVLRLTTNVRSNTRNMCSLPESMQVTKEDILATKNAIESNMGSMQWPQNFKMTCEVFDPAKMEQSMTQKNEKNNQTEQLCTLLGIINPCEVHMLPENPTSAPVNPDEIAIESEDEQPKKNNPDEIDIDDGDKNDEVQEMPKKNPATVYISLDFCLAAANISSCILCKSSIDKLLALAFSSRRLFFARSRRFFLDTECPSATVWQSSRYSDISNFSKADII
eukprot:m.50530 g.50530  ORF g.50530 m.50530 type:complete len:500 (+) comp10677_c0_seq1:105-1604(+)